MSPFLSASLALTLLTVVVAATVRGRSYARFRGVLLTLYSLIASGMVWAAGPLLPLYAALHGTVYVQSMVLVKPRMMPLWYRALVSIPGLYFAAAVLLAWPWALVSALGARPWLPWLPFAVAALGLWQSLSTRREQRELRVADGARVEGCIPYPEGTRVESSGRRQRPLRVVQLTDTHLGPFMSEGRLRRIARRAVEADPDLVLLTGDFLTMESQADPAVLRRSLEPLAALRGKVFACFGNHDHEAPDIVRAALGAIGARLLVDDASLVDTEAGPVQIVGADFSWRERHRRLAELAAAHPRIPGALRLWLLHDPGAFTRIPDGEADIVFSGHTHGGQVGLVSLGLGWTVLRSLSKIPDHGMWARGTDRLYVHRGTGHYGFPLRVGVPAEESVLSLHW